MVDVLRLRTHGVGADVVERAFRSVQPDETLTWQECRDVFDTAGGPYSYGLATALAGRGWDVVDLVLDLSPLRDAWVAEHGPLPSARGERQALALAAIARLRPRVVIDLNLKVFDLQELREIHQRFPFVERTVGVANTMKRLDRAFGHDLVLSPSRDLLDVLGRAGGPPVRPFHHAFDPARATPAEVVERSGAVFTGTVGGGDYAGRRALLVALLEAGVVEAWVRENVDRPSPERRSGVGRRSIRLRARVLEALPLAGLGRLHRWTGRGGPVLDQRLRAALELGGSDRQADADTSVSVHDRFPDRCHRPVFADEMFALLARSLVAVHREVGRPGTSLRHFEATGMGAALVADRIKGLDEVFVPGEEILTYDDAAEAVELLRWLDRDPQAAREIGQAGQARTLRDHTVSARAGQLSDILHELLGS